MYIEDMKKAARISHNLLDDDLMRIEKYACAELIRIGVPAVVIESENDLIRNAVITKALAEIGPTETKAYAMESWEYQIDNLRKHNWEVNLNVQ